MIVIADASPLIFLAKLRSLALVHAVLGRDVRLPKSVEQELLSKGADPAEAEVLRVFLRQCRIDPVPRPQQFALAMSRADNDALTLAIRARAGWLLCDDRLTRRMAEIEGIRPLGTLGLLIRASQQGLLSPAKARELVDRLVQAHSFRIGIEVYQAVLKELR